MTIMKVNWKVLWPWIANIVLVVAIGVFVGNLLNSCNGKLKKENERLREDEVVTQKVVEVEKMKEVLSDDDKRLIKDLGMKVKELESMQKVGMMTHDTVYLERKDSTSDSPLYYKDAWAEFEFQNKRLKYSVKDSLAIAVRKEYKHRFLWWRWGTKGYEVKAVNFNPHSTIRYNTYVKKKQ